MLSIYRGGGVSIGRPVNTLVGLPAVVAVVSVEVAVVVILGVGVWVVALGLCGLDLVTSVR